MLELAQAVLAVLGEGCVVPGRSVRGMVGATGQRALAGAMAGEPGLSVGSNFVCPCCWAWVGG